MKIFLILLSIVVCYSFSCNNSKVSNDTQQLTTEGIQDTIQIPKKQIEVSDLDKEKIIKQIEKLANDIDKELHKYVTTKQVVFGYSSEGTDLTGYYDWNKSIKKVVARHAGENGNLVENYYFDNDSLILVYQKNVVYEKPISQSTSTEAAAFIDDYCYFDKHLLVKWTSQYQKIKESPLIALIRDDIRQTDKNNEVIRNETNYQSQLQELTKREKEYISALSKK